MFENIVISGASSGIGAALARLYARPGTTLGLLGRDAGRLAVTAKAAREAGAIVVEGVFDIRDRTALADFLRDFDAQHPIDLLISNAGILDGRRADGIVENAEDARRVIEINLLAAIDTVQNAVGYMRPRRKGQIALVSSMAAYAPLADAPAYSASKSGLLAYGLSMRLALASEGIGVSVICPGYVATAMTETHIGNHPHKISADAAAGIIARGLQRNSAVIAFPKSMHFLSRLTPFAPLWLYRVFTNDIRFHVVPARRLE